MRSGYVAINNFNGKGEIGISRLCLEKLVKRAVDSVPGAKLNAKSNKKSPVKWLFDWDQKMKVAIYKNEQVEVFLQIVIKSGQNVQNVCLDIQKKVTANISLMCETVPLKVSIRVIGIQ